MFSAAVDSLNRIRPEPDLIVISGDLTDEGTEDEYQKLRELLVELRRPFVVLPGNHDDRGNLRAAFSDHAWLPNEGALSFALDVGELRLVALDTSVPGYITANWTPKPWRGSTVNLPSIAVEPWLSSCTIHRS